MAIEARFDLPPEQALAFFRGKGLAASFAWQDVWADEHEIAFTVAKMMDVDLLTDVRDAVDEAIANGETLDEFKRKLVPVLQKAGWWGVREERDPLTGKIRQVQLGGARRLQTIFRTNMMTAYAAGEWSQIEGAAEDAPYLMYDAVDDNRTRDQHRAWNGLVLRWDDPWWRTHRPPNGYNCRCSVIQMNGEEIAAYGYKVGKAPKVKLREVVNKRTGEVLQVPEGIDAGFDYNPGASTAERKAVLARMLDLKRKALGG